MVQVGLRATLNELYAEPTKAELVGGEIVRMAPTGYEPNQLGHHEAEVVAARHARNQRRRDDLWAMLSAT